MTSQMFSERVLSLVKIISKRCKQKFCKGIHNTDCITLEPVSRRPCQLTKAMLFTLDLPNHDVLVCYLCYNFESDFLFFIFIYNYFFLYTGLKHLKSSKEILLSKSIIKNVKHIQLSLQDSFQRKSSFSTLIRKWVSLSFWFAELPDTTKVIYPFLSTEGPCAR